MKKKVTFYCDSMNKGGTEKATLDLINSLPVDKYDITLVQLAKGGYYQQFLRKDITIKEIIPVPPKKSFKWFYRLKRLYKKIPARINHALFIGNKQDVEIACGYGYPNKIVSKSKNAKKVLWVHMDVSLDKNEVPNMTREKGKEYFKNIDEIVCVSLECADRFNGKFGLSNKTKTIYNIVPTNIIKKLADKDSSVAFDNRIFNIVSVGRLTWQKGFDILLEEFEFVIQKNNLVHLYIIGQGEDYEKLLNIVKEKKLEAYVSLLGYLDNPYPLIKNADLYVCSSRHESFGLTIVESMALGTPVLSTRCTGPNEIIENDYYGKQVDDTPGSIAAGIIGMIGRTDELKKYSQRGKERIKIFDTDAIIKEWEKIINT